MVPIEIQERPNIKSVYTCSNCERALFDGDDDHPRWNFCPMCGQEIEWDKSAKVVWEEKNCNVCGGWLVKRHPAGFWYASSDYIGMDTCYTCWLEECLATNCLGCKRGNYPDCKWILSCSKSPSDRYESSTTSNDSLSAIRLVGMRRMRERSYSKHN